MQLSVDDIEVNADVQRIIDALDEAIRYQNAGHDRTSSLGKVTSTAIDLQHYTQHVRDIETREQSVALAKFAIRSYVFATKFIEHLPKLVVDGAESYSYNGITYQFGSRYKFYKLKQEAVLRELYPYLQPTSPNALNYMYFVNPKLTSEYTGNPDNGVLDRAVWLARRNAIRSSLRLNDIDVYDDGRVNIGIMYRDNLSATLQIFETHTAYKPTAQDVYELRDELLREQTYRQERVDRDRRAEAATKFANYWNSLKDSREPQRVVDVAIDLDTIPIAPAGTASSRTWGIEIETVRANQVNRHNLPSGWEDTYDGSLPSSDCGEYCDCACDGCTSDYGDHCYEHDDDCHYDCSDNDTKSREFVSPILSSFNSRGLLSLCTDLGTRPDEAYQAGIHVHVGADDLTVFDVTRLLVAYSAIERLIEPALHRKERDYCKPMGTDQLRWWLGRLREWRRLNPDKLPTPRQVLDAEAYAARDRYVDVNLQALTKHGTIEFRAMGAWYDYDHLVRWAWIVRELVNVSKLGIDQREWTTTKTMADVIAILRKYGSELPDSQLFAELDTAELSSSEV